MMKCRIIIGLNEGEYIRFFFHRRVLKEARTVEVELKAYLWCKKIDIQRRLRLVSGPSPHTQIKRAFNSTVLPLSTNKKHVFISLLG